jgi:3-oxoacyl-[acyl-carrier-protein] synthase-3
MGIQIVSTGSRLGSLEISNSKITKMCGTSEDEIISKTGILARYYIDRAKEDLLSLTVDSISLALEEEPSRHWDIVICATYGHEYVYPSLGSRACAFLNLSTGLVFDIQSNCTGFLNALLIANDKLVADKNADSAIVIAAEANSYFMDPSDSNSVIFWSDGAGALTLRRSDVDSSGLIARAHFANFENNAAVRLESRYSDQEGVRVTLPIHQDGLATWRQATNGLPRVIKEVLENASLTSDDIDFFIFHQANLRMLEYLIAKLRIDPRKVPTNVGRIGNVGAASIPILLDELVRENRLKKGDRILFASVGAGFTFTSLIWKW